MIRDDLVTFTLVRLYFNQGYLAEAEKGLKILLEQIPEDDKKKDELLEMASLIKQKKAEKLKILMKEWVGLLSGRDNEVDS